MFSIKIRWSNIIIVAGIAILSLFLLAGSASADPPLANAAVGDLILDTEIFFPYDDPHRATTLSTTLLKEGYSLSLDDMYSDHTVAGLTIYKDEEIVRRRIPY